MLATGKRGNQCGTDHLGKVALVIHIWYKYQNQSIEWEGWKARQTTITSSESILRDYQIGKG